jgi:hypothetical protein
MWKVIQYLIFSAVVISNAHWQWTPNPYVASGVGFALAFIVTVVTVRVADTLYRVAHWAAQKMADRPSTSGKARLSANSFSN